MFAPLELLLALGQLLYTDYEAWRQGEVARLDEVWMGRREAVREELEEAADYARALGLTGQAQELLARDAGAGSGAPRISDDKRPAALIASSYVPARQLDRL